MDVDTAIKQYDTLEKHAFSEEAMKAVVKDLTGDSETLLLEHDKAARCQTYVPQLSIIILVLNSVVL